MSQKIKTILVDDEAASRESLKDILKSYQEILIAAECVNGYEAIKEIKEKNPDLVFLDIQMPKLDGFDVVELLGKDAPLVVFVTAYDEFALKAFEAEALDYILKPVRDDRMKKVIERVKGLISGQESRSLESVIDIHRSRLTPVSRVLIRDGVHVHVIPTREIVYFEAQDDYVMIYTDSRSYLKSDRISSLEGILDQTQFCRIHRSYIINVNHLSKIEPYSKDSKRAVLKNKKTLPISRSGYTRLMTLL
jgi:two-component system LytT family response regulator